MITRIIRSRTKKKNNMVVLIEASTLKEGEAIKKELRGIIRKHKELSYVIKVEVAN